MRLLVNILPHLPPLHNDNVQDRRPLAGGGTAPMCRRRGSGEGFRKPEMSLPMSRLLCAVDGAAFCGLCRCRRRAALFQSRRRPPSFPAGLLLKKRPIGPASPSGGEAALPCHDAVFLRWAAGSTCISAKPCYNSSITIFRAGCNSPPAVKSASRKAEQVQFLHRR